MARLRSKIWVQAYLKRLEIQNIAAYVTAHGDDPVSYTHLTLPTIE